MKPVWDVRGLETLQNAFMRQKVPAECTELYFFFSFKMEKNSDIPVA